MDEAYFSAGDFSSFEGESNAARFQQLLMAFKLNDTVRVMIPDCIFDTSNKDGWKSPAGKIENIQDIIFYHTVDWCILCRIPTKTETISVSEGAELIL